MKPMFRDTGLDVAESLAAGQIADLLAKHAPDKVQEFLRNPQSILGFKIPGEWATTLGGGVVGMTIAEALGKLFPGIDASAKNRIRRMAIAVGEELNDAAIRVGGDAGATTTEPSSGGRRSPMKPVNIWLYNRDIKLVVIATCPELHHVKADGTVDLAYHQVDIVSIMSTTISAPVPVNGCICAAKLQEERDAQKQTQAPKPASPSTGKAKAPSFAELVGEVFASGNAERITKVEALLALIESAGLNADERRQLEYCDNVNELLALANCKNAKALRVMLSQLRANAERGLFGQAGEKVQHVFGRVWQVGEKYKEGADKRGTELERQVAVAKLCEANNVSRMEVFAALKPLLRGSLVNVASLTEDHVIEAMTVKDGETLSPIEQYWEEERNKEQQRQQPAGTESRWSRLKKRLFHSAFGFGG